MKLLMNWIKNNVKITPTRRLAVAYWLGTFQAVLIMTVVQSGTYTSMPLALVALAIWLLIVFAYIKNTNSFAKETLWMSIKNPAKMTVDEDDLMARRGPLPGHHPLRPPAPPAPPAPRNV